MERGAPNSISEQYRQPIFEMIQFGSVEDNADLKLPQYLPARPRLPNPSRTFPPSPAYPGSRTDGARRDGSSHQSPHPHPPPPPPPPLVQAIPSRREDANSTSFLARNLVSEPPGGLNKDGERLSGGKDVLSDLHREVMGRRKQVEAQRRDLATQRQQFTKKALGLLKLRPSKTATNRRHRTTTAGHWDDIQRAFDHLKVLEPTLRETERDLELSEQKLKSAELQYHSQRVQYVPPVPPLPIPSLSTALSHHANLLADNSDTDSTTDSSQNPLVDRYYDRIGDIHLIRERMFNFEAEHRRQLAVRAALWKNQKSLEPPDPIFYERYFRKRGDFIREHFAANQEVQQLTSLCRERGLEIEDANLSPFNEAEALDRTFRDQKSISFVNTASLDGKSNISIQRLAGDIDTKARVAVWLSDVRKEESNQPFNPTRSETDHAISTLTSSISGFLTTSNPRQDPRDDRPPGFLSFPAGSPLRHVQTPNSDDEFNNLDKDQAEDMDAASRKRFSEFQADPPPRRYSEPDLARLGFPRQAASGFDIICKSCRETQAAKSVS
jgi:hypothetical protein